MARTSRALRRDFADRRAALDQRLKDLSLSNGPRRLDGPHHGSRRPVNDFAILLEELGPTFVFFGRYLSSRVDLLGEADARALRRALPEQAPALEVSYLIERLQQISGRPTSELFAAIDPHPIASEIFSQRHRGRLLDGRVVVIEVLKPAVAPFGIEALELLRHVLGRLRGGIFDPSLEEADFADFQTSLASSADLRLRAAAFKALGPSSKLRVPVPLEELCSQDVLVWLWREHSSLQTFLIPDPTRVDLAQNEALAKQLVTVWLEQALSGEPFPTELNASTIGVEEDGCLTFTGGAFATLPNPSRERLWSYLLATLAQDPDRAFEALIPEMSATAKADRESLQKRLRQVVPIRDGGLGAGADLAAYFFLHWRLARAHGFRPQKHLLAFERGFFELMAAARPLADAGDPLREGIEQIQLRNSLGSWGQMIDSDRIGRSAEEALRTLAALPERFDQLLNLAAAGHFSVRLKFEEQKDKRRSSGDVLGLLLAIGGVALLAERLPLLSGVWGERLAAVILILLAAQLMRRLMRRP